VDALFKTAVAHMQCMCMDMCVHVLQPQLKGMLARCRKANRSSRHWNLVRSHVTSHVMATLT
jgi:hypothetical protein